MELVLGLTGYLVGFFRIIALVSYVSVGLVKSSRLLTAVGALRLAWRRRRQLCRLHLVRIVLVGALALRI